MFDDIQSASRAMQASAHYDAPGLASQIAAIDQALAASAEKVDDALRATDDAARRQALRTVYRGLQASRRGASRLADLAQS
ncbi:hypothetical protein ANDA3_0599 [plant metagenome]|uniref:Uncharacterized protein n=2 Tax=root TaxID=1 RepID=A0A1C3K283_9BURK|nr:hypothetical protein [Orrella dioscoreae]SBT25613.1 hypothetical protein ODI_03541 [Orrella dioscoreae]SOE47016.1 hypothetical protein ODI_R0599 [Orrella dioscoreae]